MNDKQKIMSLARSEEDRLFLARLFNSIEAAQKYYKPVFTNFLSLHEQALAQAACQQVPELYTRFFGGYSGAERKMASLSLYEWAEQYPIRYLEISSKKGFGGLSHRDFLGSIMALGVRRETIGDILILDNIAVAICEPVMGQYLSEHLKKIGKLGVSCKLFEEYTVVAPPKKVEEICGTVASLRLDSVIALGFHISRSESLKCVCAGKVMLNFMEASSPAKELNEGDIISVHGFGRIQLVQIGKLTKKGRQAVVINKFV